MKLNLRPKMASLQEKKAISAHSELSKNFENEDENMNHKLLIETTDNDGQRQQFKTLDQH